MNNRPARAPNTASLPRLLGLSEDQVAHVEFTDPEAGKAFLDQFDQKIQDLEQRKRAQKVKNGGAQGSG